MRYSYRNHSVCQIILPSISFLGWLQLIFLLIVSHTYRFLCNFFYFNFYLFIYFWLCWVFVSVWGLSLVVASRGHSSSRCAGLSLSRPLLLQSTGSRRAGSVVVVHGLSCSAACGIFPDQGSNPCALHWQADSQPLRHQGSPLCNFWSTSNQEFLIIKSDFINSGRSMDLKQGMLIRFCQILQKYVIYIYTKTI